MSNGDVSLDRIERNIDAIEREIKEMRHALKVFASNPKKYEPQLLNLVEAAYNTMKSARVIIRAAGALED